MKSTHKRPRLARPQPVPSGRLQFKTPIWLVMQSALGKDSRISNKAITVLDTFALEICTRLVQKAREAAFPSKVLARSQLQEAVSTCLTGSLATRAVDQANRRSSSYGGVVPPPVEVSVDSPPARDEPLHFSPRQLERYIRAQGMTTHTEFLVRELLVLADKVMRENGGTRITPGYLHRAVHNEESINALFLFLITSTPSTSSSLPSSSSTSSTPPPSSS
ncbi:uncharacterized protein ACA1_273110 [Acanthamoeba castellanii str. Neff]|uniref:Histone H2A n=1 Tax=Acanthamoeba castellanii (strain ATCC 30010 / Neff) TaxID=1257118 RepID=L8GFI1_ACACF|nr:uncharacterized protein ACA1_273110 [Acanthamoeba castellanii str. Neff]ELR11850.1 hypothetical protein ACA1_273110 [Acanthamoeba castellanii str. Neff]